MAKVTISQVAKEANVSIATVSRVISNSPLISEKTKKKVQKVIDKFDFVPNCVAQNLITSQSKIIGIVLNAGDLNPLSNDFFSEILGIISDYLLKKNYYIIYSHFQNDEDEIKYIKSLVNTRRVDAFIFLRAYENEQVFEYLNDKDFPFAIIGRPKDSDKFLWVDNDNIKASYDITKLVISKSKKKLCFFSGPKKLNVSKKRYEGYIKALKENDLESVEWLESDFNIKSAKKNIRNFLKENTIDAIITTDDILAIASLSVIKELKLKNIEVTGFNNSQIRQLANFDFLTVDIDTKMLGVEACKLVLNKLNEHKINSNYSIIDTKIIKEDKIDR